MPSVRLGHINELSPFSKCYFRAQGTAWYPEIHRKFANNNHRRLCWWRSTSSDLQHSSDTTSLAPEQGLEEKLPMKMRLLQI